MGKSNIVKIIGDGTAAPLKVEKINVIEITPGAQQRLTRAEAATILGNRPALPTEDENARISGTFAADPNRQIDTSDDSLDGFLEAVEIARTPEPTLHQWMDLLEQNPTPIDDDITPVRPLKLVPPLPAQPASTPPPVPTTKVISTHPTTYSTIARSSIFAKERRLEPLQRAQWNANTKLQQLRAEVAKGPYTVDQISSFVEKLKAEGLYDVVCKAIHAAHIQITTNAIQVAERARSGRWEAPLLASPLQIFSRTRAPIINAPIDALQARRQLLSSQLVETKFRILTENEELLARVRSGEIKRTEARFVDDQKDPALLALVAKLRAIDQMLARLRGPADAEQLIAALKFDRVETKLAKINTEILSIHNHVPAQSYQARPKRALKDLVLGDCQALNLEDVELSAEDRVVLAEVATFINTHTDLPLQQTFNDLSEKLAAASNKETFLKLYGLVPKKNVEAVFKNQTPKEIIAENETILQELTHIAVLRFVASEQATNLVHKASEVLNAAMFCLLPYAQRPEYNYVLRRELLKRVDALGEKVRPKKPLDLVKLNKLAEQTLAKTHCEPHKAQQIGLEAIGQLAEHEKETFRIILLHANHVDRQNQAVKMERVARRTKANIALAIDAGAPEQRANIIAEVTRDLSMPTIAQFNEVLATIPTNRYRAHPSNTPIRETRDRTAQYTKIAPPPSHWEMLVSQATRLKEKVLNVSLGKIKTVAKVALASLALGAGVQKAITTATYPVGVTAHTDSWASLPDRPAITPWASDAPIENSDERSLIPILTGGKETIAPEKRAMHGQTEIYRSPTTIRVETAGKMYAVLYGFMHSNDFRQYYPFMQEGLTDQTDIIAASASHDMQRLLDRVALGDKVSLALNTDGKIVITGWTRGPLTLLQRPIVLNMDRVPHLGRFVGGMQGTKINKGLEPIAPPQAETISSLHRTATTSTRRAPIFTAEEAANILKTHAINYPDMTKGHVVRTTSNQNTWYDSLFRNVVDGMKTIWTTFRS